MGPPARGQKAFDPWQAVSSDYADKVTENIIDVGQGAAQDINPIPCLELFGHSFLAMLYELNRIKSFKDVFF